MQASVHRYDDEDGSGSVLLNDGREIPFDGKVITPVACASCALASG